jgi:hypothetical protein
MNIDYSKFTTLEIAPDAEAENAYGIDGGIWKKSEVLVDLNDGELTSCYPGPLGWTDYLLGHVLMEVEDYDVQLVTAFLASAHLGELTIDLPEGGNITFIKSGDED